MNYLLKVKIYFYLNKFLFVLAILIIFKFIFDFYFISQKVLVKKDYANYQYDKFITKPRLQTETNGFEYIKAESGFVENNNYYFQIVDAIGDFGTMKAGKLEIIDGKILNFSVDPKFSIFIEDKK